MQAASTCQQCAQDVPCKWRLLGTSLGLWGRGAAFGEAHGPFFWEPLSRDSTNQALRSGPVLGSATPVLVGSACLAGLPQKLQDAPLWSVREVLILCPQPLGLPGAMVWPWAPSLLSPPALVQALGAPVSGSGSPTPAPAPPPQDTLCSPAGRSQPGPRSWVGVQGAVSLHQDR